MDIVGLQKMTLLDYPGKIASTVFLNGCNMRCPFCHNSRLLSGKEPPLMTEAELLSFLKKRQGMLDGVCVTGGEPTLSEGLPALLRQIKDLGYLVKLDTNGTRPQLLRQLVEEGLVDYVAMDIKNSPSRYAETAGRPLLDINPVLESIRYLGQGHVDYEFRTTVVQQLHTAEDIRGMVGLMKQLSVTPPRWYLQPFTDRDTVAFAGLSAPEKEELETWCGILSEICDNVAIRGL